MTEASADLVERLTSVQRDAILKGPRVRMRVELLHGKKEVHQGWFRPPVLIDTMFVDENALRDPARSDMPAMVALVRLGIYGRPTLDMRAEDDFYEWNLTDRGLQLAEALRTLGAPK